MRRFKRWLERRRALKQLRASGICAIHFENLEFSYHAPDWPGGWYAKLCPKCLKVAQEEYEQRVNKAKAVLNG
jgi:hypothetical protein